MKEAPCPFSLDALLAVQLRIARRADELARGSSGSGTSDPLDLWRQAEEEVWVECGRLETAVTR